MSLVNQFKSFSTYTLVSVFGSAAGLILMPVLTHYLSKEDYGTLALFNTYVQLIIPFISLSAFGLVSIEYFNKHTSQIQFKSIFSSISLIPIPGFFLLLIVSMLFKKTFSDWLNIPESIVAYICSFAVLSVFLQQFQSFVIIQRKSRLYAFINIAKTVAEYSLALMFVIRLERGWFGRVEAAMSIFLLLVLISLWFYRKWNLLTSKIEWINIKAGLIYGIPLIAHVIGRFVINQSDKIFISKMVSNSELGVYNTGYLLGSIIMIFSGAFINVYNPYLFKRLSDINEKKKIEIVRLSYLFIISLLLVTLGLSIISPLLFRWFINDSYANGAQYVFWIAISYFFWGVYLVFSGFLFYFKQTKVLAYIALLNVSLNLGLNYLLINVYETIGAAYATTISFFIVMVVVVGISSKRFPMPWLNFREIVSFKV